MQHCFAAEEMAEVFSIDTSTDKPVAGSWRTVFVFRDRCVERVETPELMQSTEIDREEARREFDLENSGAEPRANKKRRKLCSESSCTRQAQSGGRCIKHSAVKKKRKLCSESSCTRQAQIGGRCIKHSAVKKKQKQCSRSRVARVLRDAAGAA
jgi:hypothetical protein